MALDIKDIHTNVGYDFVTHMKDMIHNEIVGAQAGELRNFKFHEYSFLMHLILFYNKEHVGHYLLEAIEEFRVQLLVQLWTWFWHYFYPFSNFLFFYNDFSCPIMKRLGAIVERVPRTIRKMLKPHKCHDDNMKPLEHD